MPEPQNAAGNGPKVSIIVPTFNRADMLPTAIDSSLAQDFDVEVIVVNHGSTDNTDDVVAAYGDRIRYIKRDEDFGPHFFVGSMESFRRKETLSTFNLTMTGLSQLT